LSKNLENTLLVRICDEHLILSMMVLPIDNRNIRVLKEIMLCFLLGLCFVMERVLINFYLANLNILYLFQLLFRETHMMKFTLGVKRLSANNQVQ
jgi:hypothetical protein